MRMLLWCLANTALAASAAPVGYARATGHYLEEQRPSLYAATQTLDGRPGTAWCSATRNARKELLSFGFKDSVRIDEIRIRPGRAHRDSTFEAFGRPRSFILRGPTGGRKFRLQDSRDMQSFTFSPTLRGQQFFLEILDSFPGNEKEAPVCISDIVFYSRGKPLNGPFLISKMKWSRRTSPLWGTWFGGMEGAPERFLSFYFDGTFSFISEPFDASSEKPVKAKGRYQVWQNRLILIWPGGKKFFLPFELERDGGAKALTFSGKLPPGFTEKFQDRQ